MERDSGEPGSEGTLTYDAKLTEFPPELDEQLNAFLKVMKNSNPENFTEKRKRAELKRSVIIHALNAKLAQYPTSLHEDEQLLKEEGMSMRQRMAIEVRVGEKRLLQEAIDLMQGEESTTRTTDSERNSKKAKTVA